MNFYRWKTGQRLGFVLQSFGDWIYIAGIAEAPQRIGTPLKFLLSPGSSPFL
jgi:hypothetical protein